MSESDNLPIASDGNTKPGSACRSHCKGSMLIRSLVYTPVILAATGLAAMAMFPDLADRALGSSRRMNANSSCSSGNPYCPIQMLMRAFSSERKPETQPQLRPPLKQETANPTDSSAVAMEMFDCCPHSRCGMQLKTESTASPSDAVESAAFDEPADALAAVLASQAKPESQEQPATND